MAETVIAEVGPPPPQGRPRVREVSSRFMSPETARSLESPFQRRQQQQQPRSVMKLFNENENHNNTSKLSSTPDTSSSSSSRLRTTPATKLLHSISPQGDTSSIVDHATPTPCSRSLNLQNGFFSSFKGREKPTLSNSAKIGGLPLPPLLPPQPKLVVTDARKVRKVSVHQEDAHSIKLLHNHYLQWRFVNAKAEASTQAQRTETEKSLYSLAVKISELYDSIKRKCIELEILKRTKSLSTILKAQMPYLDEWCAFEEDYSSSLSETTQALLNVSIQLPVGRHVRADVREVGESLNSAAKLMEIINLHLQSLMPKAEELEIFISELAKVTGGERALVEECGGLLSKTHTFQVEECSLRGQLMQLHQRLAASDPFQQEISNSSLNAVHMR